MINVFSAARIAACHIDGQNAFHVYCNRRAGNDADRTSPACLPQHTRLRPAAGNRALAHLGDNHNAFS
jgi:hypothetical protein